MSHARIVAMALALCVATTASAEIDPLSFNDFYSDPGAPIAISADGSTATFTESPALSVVFLSNIPALGDPAILIGSANSYLQFDYSFNLAANNQDVFHAAVLNGTTGDSLGGAYDLSVPGTSSGTYKVDLSAQAGQTLGLQFELASLIGDLGFDSSLTLSNLEVVTAGVVNAPEPPPALLMLPIVGVLLLLERRRRTVAH